MSSLARAAGRVRWAYQRHLATLVPELRAGLAGRRWTGPRRPGAALLHVGRCGSTLLGRMREATPGVAWDGEPLDEGQARRLPRVLLGFGAAQVESLPEAIRCAGERQWVGSLLFGQFTRLGHRDAAESLRRLEEAGVQRLVVLERRHMLRVLTSWLVAAARDSWHSTSAGPRPKDVKVRVPITSCPVPSQRRLLGPEAESLLGYLRMHRAWYAQLREALAPRPHLWLSYHDDVLPDPVASYRRVCDFLDLAPAPVAPALQRTTPEPLHALIENWPEVEDALTGTDQEDLLEEPA